MPNRKYPSSSYARILFRHLRLNEENCQGYFEGTEVCYEDLMTLDGSISSGELAQMYRNALAISDISDLGLSVGALLHLPTHGPLGVAAFSAPDLRVGLSLLVKYGHIRVDSFDVSISEHKRGLTINFSETVDLGDLRIFLTESVLSALFSAITFFVGAGQFRGHVHFSYSKPSYGYKYQEHFGDNIKFNQNSTEVYVSEAILSTPSLVADAVMHQQAVEACEQHLKEIKKGDAIGAGLSTGSVVSKLMAENPGRIWTLAEVAAMLNMSSRTLIRKLDGEGTKFQTIRDELAKEQATTYLRDASLSVESVGYLMGFSDVSSFRRSFKRWFGETPSQYMARNR